MKTAWLRSTCYYKCFEAFFDWSGKILSSNWSSKSFEAFVASSEPKSDTSEKLIPWSHAVFQHLMEAPSPTITPTGSNKFVGTTLCTLVYRVQMNMRHWQGIAPFNHSNTPVAPTSEIFNRCIPTEITMNAKTKWKLSNTCFINTTIMYIGDCTI